MSLDKLSKSWRSCTAVLFWHFKIWGENRLNCLKQVSRDCWFYVVYIPESLLPVNVAVFVRLRAVWKRFTDVFPLCWYEKMPHFLSKETVSASTTNTQKCWNNSRFRWMWERSLILNFGMVGCLRHISSSAVSQAAHTQAASTHTRIFVNYVKWLGFTLIFSHICGGSVLWHTHSFMHTESLLQHTHTHSWTLRN